MSDLGELTMVPVVDDKFTPEQRAAINACGRTIVSASAGSGKTTVMIEKMIRLICSGKVDVSEILAVTYTKKAAASMKEKLRKALVKAYNEGADKERERLKRQIEQVPTADISTIHSFCSKLIKTHFFAVDVGNRFTIIAGEDADGLALKNQAIDEIFEAAYEEKDEAFFALLSVYFRKKSDNRLRKILSGTYDKLRTDADYGKMLDASGDDRVETFDKISADLFALLKQKCEYYLRQLAPFYDYFSQNGPTRDALKLVLELQGALCALINAGNLFAACQVEKPSFTRKDNCKKLPDDVLAQYTANVAKLAKLREKVVKIYDRELSQFADEGTELERYKESCVLARALAKYLKKLDERYSQLKRAKGVLDYADLEHYALKLLSMDEVAQEMRSRYKYVFVDEYQDVNPVQERILNALYGENVFLVGDIKQSIYGFRGSKSKFFAQKQAEYEAEHAAGKNSHSLLLTKNFRSADAVLDAVNRQFSIAMTKDNSEVDYQNTSVMERGGLFSQGSGRVLVHFVEETDEGEKADKAAQTEDDRGVYSVRANAGKKAAKASRMAERIAQIIKKEVPAGRWYNAETKRYESVSYKDIAVLSRKKGDKVAEVIAALAAKGIPVTANAPVNICTYPEIKMLIDVLRLIDNGEQDVPLCTALLSPMAGLTEDDLAKIRLQFPATSNFREACRRYEKTQQDAIAQRLLVFYERLKRLRMLAQVADAGEVLVELMAECNVEEWMLHGGGGENCLKRIHRFLEETHAQEGMDVAEFLARLKMLDYEIEYCENGGEDAVHVLTMHASKGLEYPVVIVENLSDKFHGADTDDVFVEETYGLAPKCYHVLERTQHATLLRRLYDRKQATESVRDELNLYYVALTRAQYALHMLFDEEVLLPDLCYAKSFAELTTFSAWERYQATEEGGMELPYEERQMLAVEADEELTAEIARAMAWKYSHTGAEDLPIKTSATALMKMVDGGTSHVFMADPLDASGENDEDEAEETDIVTGKAYHAFLQYFDFSCLQGDVLMREAVEQELGRMHSSGAFEEAWFAFLDVDRLVEILSYPIFAKVVQKTLYREQKFMVALPYRDVLALMDSVSADSVEEDVLFQGEIDLLAKGEDGVEIIDYKYSKKGAEALKKKYSLQLQLYKKAVAKVWKVSEKDISCTIVNIFRGFEVQVD